MTVTQRAAAVTLRAAARPKIAPRVPVFARLESSQPGKQIADPTLPEHTSKDAAAMIPRGVPSDEQARHSPDWEVAQDYRTS